MASLLDDLLDEMSGKKKLSKATNVSKQSSTVAQTSGSTSASAQVEPPAKRPKLCETKNDTPSIPPEQRTELLKQLLQKEKEEEAAREKEIQRLAEEQEKAKQEDVLKRTIVVTTKEECEKATKYLKKQKLIAVDCEWIGIGREAELSLVQVATGNSNNAKVYIFDILVGGRDLFDYGLRDILQSNDIVKIFHDCRWDSDILYRVGNVVLNNVFDTQIAYCIYCQQTASYTPIPVSLNAILKKFASGQSNINKEAMHKAMEENPDYWRQRPLSSNMLQYISEDVLHLPLVYRQITSVLVRSNMKFVLNYSKQYVDQLRTAESISDDSKLVGGLPQYGIPQWDAEVKRSIERKKNKSDIRGTRQSAVDRQLSIRDKL